MLSKSRGSYVSVLQSPAVFTKTMVQGPTCLANVGAGAFSTWDAVHHTFPAIGRYWVHKLLPQGPVGTECNLDGQGGQDPTNGLGQSTDVGESHRSTGHLVTWSPLIRLWAGVLVNETLGVTISLEGLASPPGHDSLLTTIGPLLCTSVSSPQPVCGLQGGGSERTDTDLCGWPYGTQRC